ncbi:UDP-N-acetyl-D-galactosamine dehydrogenase [Pedobacter psychrotolerans]|uniref:UDP-N-acetyl-D-galactosamine dehydrogenase n=1 Tax=Pedobacter psychrotolerans TaxID=1843235 RepID=A0A4R2HFL5_9SPHI|nr:nucleotide sugar dehydrogenase [Pedobacter psychrotolerans]TCO27200.1 UDP-N-acetyl-D-galactosamine dehydrogenase [Pedobacter psychrotolerans]GGE59730.1 UDP-glucose/GDP-mannose dehydrogenase [Pedobacter psychrotolerans]
MDTKKDIAIIGLGYVGLPLAVEFAKHFRVIGFDINESRVKSLGNLVDLTHEANLPDLAQVLALNEAEKGLRLSSNLGDLASCCIYIVTVPTPIDHLKRPDLQPLLKASEMIGSILKKGDLVIYESTVYPGCTEEDCVPELERVSGLQYNQDFFCGYSPERINPGDKINTLTKIKKVTSGSTPEIANEVNALYATIITAGTHLAPSIKVAEASKAIENAQRDVNISFVNELALIFDRMEIDTSDVLAAAATKWNFLNYKPGLVGGHCIGVDPYYLAHKSEALGYKPEVILSGRRVNDNMGMFVANKIIKMLVARNKHIQGAKVLILGFTFKENCPDTRNTKVIDIHKELQSFSIQADVHDPWANREEVKLEYGIDLIAEDDFIQYDAVILAVAHHAFQKINFKLWKDKGTIIFDTKSFINREAVDARL